MIVTDKLRPSSCAVIMTAIVVAVGIADQLSKTLMLHLLAEDNIMYVFGDWFRFRLLFNSGGAFSIGTNTTWLFTTFQLGFLVAVVVYSRFVTDRWTAVFVGLVGGGALGNVTDRLFRAPGFFVGHVVDFVSVGSFAVFNVADMAISCGAAGLLVLMFFDGLTTRRGRGKGTNRTNKGTNNE